MKKYLICLLLFSFIPKVQPVLVAQAPVGVVTDPVHTVTTGVVAVVTEISNFIREHGVQILEWTKKALQVINAVVANYELIQKTEGVFSDIFSLYEYTYNLIGEHPNLEDKVKYILVLEEIVVKGVEELEIFSSIFRTGGIVMDDYGRIQHLKEAYEKAVKYRRILRFFRMRVTREIFSKGLSRQSRDIYAKLFEYN